MKHCYMSADHITGWMKPRKLTMKANRMKKLENFLRPFLMFL